MLYGRLNTELPYWTLGKQQQGQPEATEVLSPTSVPHRPVLPLQPRNKAPPTPNTTLRGGRERWPCSLTFPNSIWDVQQFQWGTSTKHGSLRNALGLHTFPLMTLQLLFRAPGSQPSSMLYHCPTSLQRLKPESHTGYTWTREPNPTNPASPHMQRWHFTFCVRQTTLLSLSLSLTAKQTPALQVNCIQTWLGRCHFSVGVKRRAQPLECLLQRMQRTRYKHTMLMLASLPLQQLVLIQKLWFGVLWQKIFQLKTQAGWLILEDWYEIALGLFTRLRYNTSGDKSSSLSLTEYHDSSVAIFTLHKSVSISALL